MSEVDKKEETIQLLTDLSVVPVNDGGVQFEWHMPGGSVEIEISPDGKISGEALFDDE